MKGIQPYGDRKYLEQKKRLFSCTGSAVAEA